MQVLAGGLVAPTFAEMYIDFGSELPALSRGVIASHYFWTLAGAGGIVWSIILFIWGRRNLPIVRRSAIAIAVSAFVIGQTLTVALFLPIFQLSSVVGDENAIQDIDPKDGEPGATDNLDGAQSIREGFRNRSIQARCLSFIVGQYRL